MSFSLLTADDLYLFNEGTHIRLHDKLGSHLVNHDGVDGVYFAVWAPNARAVSVFGSFNEWTKEQHDLTPVASSGIWEGFVPGVPAGASYKYHVEARQRRYSVDKADPFAAYSETPPETGSRVWDLSYEWGDAEWMERRAGDEAHTAPISIYEVHAGSWRRNPGEGHWPLTYREMAHELAGYVADLGFTHVEFLPLMEHPFGGSWGYQTTGYFAPTARYGTPQDLMYLIDVLHQHGIGVILDWVPSHFATDEHGLGYFDGTHLYEHADQRQGFHPDWGSFIFNYDRNEVRSFLLSSAVAWLDRYHADGIRVDAVASMLYLDYSRDPGGWIPNRFGGRENLGAIGFLRDFNRYVYRDFPGVQTYAEESTAWPNVSRPLEAGGLGFGFKWDMGWMHDTLAYLSRDPVHRRHHHRQLTFRGLYAYTENFCLPLSHDEVVHGKGSLVNKMAGDDWQKFANLRLLFGYQFAQPGKKLIFMGGEFGQRAEWDHDVSLDWHLLEHLPHQGVRNWVRDLAGLYRGRPALHAADHEPAGLDWVSADEADASVLAFLRVNPGNDDRVLAVFNFTPVPRDDFVLGVPSGGVWREILNSDAEHYWGSGVGNQGAVTTTGIPHGRFPDSLQLTLPPLAAVFLGAE